jgi:hypothetical protein
MGFPIKRRKTVIVEWWDCGEGDVKGHHHQTKETAENCIKKKHVDDGKIEKIHKGKARYIKLLFLVIDGEPIKTAAEKSGVSYQQALTWLHRFERTLFSFENKRGGHFAFFGYKGRVPNDAASRFHAFFSQSRFYREAYELYLKNNP